MDVFETKYQDYLKEFNVARKMVLSTSKDDVVSSRMMCVLLIEDKYYFQTDVNFRKYEEIINNPNVALCIDNIQIEGKVKELGKPINNPLFMEKFKKSYLGSFNAYSNLKNERLFVVEAKRIQRWVYIDKQAYIEVFDIQNKEYKIDKYIGI